MSANLHLFIYAGACVGALLCFTPILMGVNINLEIIHGQTKPVQISLTSSYSNGSILVCLGVVVTIFIDFIVDLYLRIHKSYLTLTAIWTLLLSVLIPDIIILSYIAPTGLYIFLPAILSTKTLFMYLSSVCLIHTYASKTFDMKLASIAVLVLVTYSVCVSVEPFLPNKSWVCGLYILKYVVSGFGSSFYVFIGLRWCRGQTIKDWKNRELSMDEYCGLVHILLLAVLIISSWIVGGTTGGSKNFMLRDTTYFVSMRCLHIVYVAIVTLFYGRVYRRELTLLHAQKEAETKRMLVGYFSHKMRTPLNSVSMGLEILSSKFMKLFPDKDLLTVMSDLRTSCESTVDILNDLLTYERLISGTLQLSHIPVPIQRLLQELIHPIVIQMQQKDIQFELLFEDCGESWSNAVVIADEHQLSKAISNILSYSCNSTPTFGRIRIRISMVDVHPVTGCSGFNAFSKMYGHSKGRLKIEIQDTAHETDDEALFTDSLDFQAGVHYTDDSAGLGLWIARRILTLHEGKVDLMSTQTATSTSDTITDNTAVPFNPDEKELIGRTFLLDLPVYIEYSHSSIITTSGSFLSDGAPRPSSSRRPFHNHVQSHSLYELHTHSTLSLGGGGVGGGLGSPSGHPSLFFSSAGVSRRSMSSDCSCRFDEPDRYLQLHRHHSRSHSLDDPEIIELFPTTLEVHEEPSVADCTCPTTPISPDDASSPSTAGSSTSSSPDSVIRVIGPRSRVLIVDDAAMNRKMLSRLLEESHVTTTMAENGEVAVALVRDAIATDPFDLVLIDYQMPVMDGPTAVKLMRDAGFLGPILGITGNTLRQDVETFVAHGADRVLPKPVQLQTILTSLRDLGKLKVLQSQKEELES